MFGRLVCRMFMFDCLRWLNMFIGAISRVIRLTVCWRPYVAPRSKAITSKMVSRVRVLCFLRRWCPSKRSLDVALFVPVS